MAFLSLKVCPSAGHHQQWRDAMNGEHSVLWPLDCKTTISSTTYGGWSFAGLSLMWGKHSQPQWL